MEGSTEFVSYKKVLVFGAAGTGKSTLTVPQAQENQL